MKHKLYVPGCYKLTEQVPVLTTEVIWFDGDEWWLPGWECPLELGTTNGSFTIAESLVGELIWAKP